MVTFYHFVRAALHRLMGASIAPLPLVRVRSASAIRKKPGRTEYQRGILAPGADGMLEVRVTGQQGSGVLRSMSEANCFIVLAHDQGSVAAGESVEIMLFDGLI
jgi:molybdopterin molybdotransferase